MTRTQRYKAARAKHKRIVRLRKNEARTHRSKECLPLQQGKRRPQFCRNEVYPHGKPIWMEDQV